MVADIRATGRMAGVLLVENLFDLARGQVPINAPLGGVARCLEEDAFSGVHFMDGEREQIGFPFVAPGPLRRWMARPELDDAVLIHHLPETRELHVLLPACRGGDWFELVVWFAYVVVDGDIRVSTPDYQKASTVESRLYHDLIDAMNEGISTHERAPMLEGAWGVLGSYLGVDKQRTRCDAATKGLHDPLIELGKQRARHRLYPGAVTLDERDRHLEAVETRSPIAFETCLDAIYDNGIALVYRLDEP